MTHNISEFLNNNGIETQLYTTKKPDIVFEIGGKKYAIEIETGTMLTRRKALVERVKLLNEDYDEWFFVVTDPNKLGKYKEYGESVNSRYTKGRLNKILKSVKKG